MSMRATVPSSKAWSSMVALSVSTSAMVSPAETSSPTDLCHLMSVPSSMVSDSRGISMGMGMARSPWISGGWRGRVSGGRGR